MTTILGIKISNKQESAKNVQNILSEYCCYIKTRLGINSYDEQTCSNEGLILVDIPNTEKVKDIKKALSNIENITVKKMEF